MLAPIFQRFGPKFVFFFAKAPVIYNTKSTHKNAKSPTSGGAGYHGNHGSLGLGLLKNPGLESSWLKSPGLKSLGLKSPGLKYTLSISLKDISTLNFSTPDFSTPDFSTMNFPTLDFSTTPTRGCRGRHGTQPHRR